MKHWKPISRGKGYGKQRTELGTAQVSRAEGGRVSKVNGKAEVLSDGGYENSILSSFINAECSIFSVWILD
jgi:hypothetical protein